MANVNSARKKEAIKVKLSTILQKAAGNPKFEGVTIVDIKLSPDSTTALVLYSVYSSAIDPDEITKALNSAAGYFQKKLANTLRSRNTPKLKFAFDSGFDHTDKIERLLSTIEIKPEEESETE